ncbi:free fatty acid receptor 1 [Sarcophilus harrisii]|uniref:Free fatty acid receptor 1 n=1 Tax=Sarcophilus harrisii TaxID=9305 RepID=G3VX52_SARHA|nr:free fatty acid receptor 1 [Sarcophilus harrisii]
MDIPMQLSFALYAAAFTLGLPLNVILLSEAVSHARLRLTPSLVYTLQLACSDLLLTASLPLKAAEALAGGAWPLPASLCPAFALIHFVPLYSGGGFLAALSVGRYLGAAFPLGYQAARRPCYSWGVCVGIWGLVFFHLGLVLGLETLGGQVDNSTKSLGLTIPINGSPVCLEAWDPIWAGPARLSISLLLFFLPLAITAFCYVGCLRALVRSGLSRSRKLRAARVAGGALLTLLLCLGPYNASHVVGFVKPYAGGHWRKLGLIMGSWSTVLNPLVSGCLGNRAGQRHGTIGTPGGTAQK